jgi:hypothetical protein
MSQKPAKYVYIYIYIHIYISFLSSLIKGMWDFIDASAVAPPFAPPV